MNLFCFASRSIENIRLGIEYQLWAVGTLLNQQSMAGRVTKARRYLLPGAFGVFYCNPLHSFTTPFIVRSYADPDAVVRDVWPEPWVLPFKIQTLGDLSRRVSAEEAAERWPVVKKRLAVNRGKGGVSAAMNITGTTVFVPVSITREDWERICSDLATKPC
jgi:hypothetical protein